MNSLESILSRIQPQDKAARMLAKDRLSRLTMPYWAMGRLMDLAEDLAGMTGTITPSVKRKAMVVMAADHGVAREGVSLYPSEVTAQMVANFLRGGATINVLAGLAGAKVVVADLGVAADMKNFPGSDKLLDLKVRLGTDNMTEGPAMSKEEALSAIMKGCQLADELCGQYDLLGTGEMGIGNTTSAAALMAVFSSLPVEEVAGRGTGIDEIRFQRKVDVIRKAIRVNAPDPRDPLDVLAKVGGFEIAGLTGFILGCAANRKPILVDGYISTAAALVACELAPKAREYMIAAHCSAERGHVHMLSFLGKKPLLDLEMRLGEGSGSALAMPLVEAARGILVDVSTFEEAAVSGPAV